MTKRYLSIILAILAVLLSLTSCRSSKEESDGRLQILTTVFPPYDIAKNVGGDLVSVSMLMSPGTDSHSYSGDSPSDILKIERCDVFLCIGGESEKWVRSVTKKIEDSGGKIPTVVKLAEYCDLLAESDEGILGESSEHGHHHEDGFDEHVWTSLKNYEKMTVAVRDCLISADPKNADSYRENADSYVSKIRSLHGEFDEFASSLDKRILVFADRFPFRYFAEDYGFECYAAFNGCASESEPSPTSLSKLCLRIEEEGLNCVFYTETSQSGVPNTVSKATGADNYLLHSCHTISEKQLRSGIGYLDLMKQNLDTLKKAMNYDS